MAGKDPKEPEFVIVQVLNGEMQILGHEPQIGMASASAETFAQGAGREGTPVFILKAIRSVTAVRKYQLDHRDIK